MSYSEAKRVKQLTRYRPGRLVEAVYRCGTGEVKIRFFNVADAPLTQWQRNRVYYLYTIHAVK